MKIILDKLKSVEQQKNVEILLAVESGSRAWGFASPDSDFDIRFIYKNNKNWYLSPWEKSDTIEFMTDEDLDGSGWDLKKTFQLLGKSNPPLLEWLNSPIFYYKNEKFLKSINEIATDCFSPISTAHHYLSMSKKYLELCREENIKLKRYFYCLRTTLANLWIIEKNTFPPVLMNEMFELLPKNILEKVNYLIELKSEKGEDYLHPQDWEMFHFLEETISKNEVNSKKLSGGKLDKITAERIFIEILEQ